MRFSATRLWLGLAMQGVVAMVSGCSSDGAGEETASGGVRSGGAPSVNAGSSAAPGGSNGAQAGSATSGAAGTTMVSGGGVGGQPLPPGGAGGAAGTAGASAAGGGAGGASGAAGGGGMAGSSMRCKEIESEYASSLAEQVACTAGAANQCGSRVEGVPGCSCRVFIQPKDPFAIEHLFNLQADWFDADCDAPQCPADCPDGQNGVCAEGQCAPP